MLTVAIDRATRGTPLSDDEARDFAQLVDEEKGTLQMISYAHHLTQIKRLSPIREAMGHVYGKLLDPTRIAAAPFDVLLKLAQYLDNREDKIHDMMAEATGQTTPKHLTSIILQQKNQSEEDGMTGDIASLPPSTRAKLRFLFELMKARALEVHEEEKVREGAV